MQIVSLADNLHDMSNPIIRKIRKIISKCLFIVYNKKNA